VSYSDFPYRLYLVVSDADCKHHTIDYVVEEAILGGVDLIQLREKHIDKETFVRKAIQIKSITDKYKVPLIINDVVDVAIEIEAWGVHVGRSDMPPSEIYKLPNCPKHIGWSLELLEQLNSSELNFVHHLGISPVFASKTKIDTITNWGVDGIQTIRQKTDLPLVAIGGIDETNIQDVVRAGAHCVAVVSAICGSENPRLVAQNLKRLIHEA